MESGGGASADSGLVWNPERSASEIDMYTRGLLERRRPSVSSHGGGGVASTGGGSGTGHRRSRGTGRSGMLAELLDTSSVLSDAAAALVDDSFSRCFAETPAESWNWNWYLLPMWVLGVFLRHCVLFPFRLVVLLGGFGVFALAFFPVHYFMRESTAKRRLLSLLVQFLASCFVASWTGVIKYHGPRPTQRPGQVFVANHTSMIDFIILSQQTPFSVIMQRHGGWVGFIQSTVLEAIHCIQFNRSDIKDRATVAARLKEHVASPNVCPLLIFPEGTCVNNEYCVMFKRGAFDLGVTVCPIAIKYNKIFVDAFHNSKRVSFTRHLYSLMTSWAVVADVWYLEPQVQGQGEDPIEFSDRVKRMICERAGLKAVPWDGMYKYLKPSPAMCERQRKVYADRVRELLHGDMDEDNPQREGYATGLSPREHSK